MASFIQSFSDSTASSFLRISAWLARVMGYQTRSGKATAKKSAGTGPKKRRMPRSVRPLCATLGT